MVITDEAVYPFDGVLGVSLAWHGAVEKYNKRGKHLGEFDPITDEQTKDADKTKGG